MFWYGAYIKTNLNQIDIQEALQNTFPSESSVSLLQPEQFRGLYHHAALTWKLLTISPNQKGWVGLWGLTTKLNMQIFQKNRVSGLVLEFEDEKDSKSWSYQIWESGLLLDWFISDPIAYFEAWGRSSLEETLMPYLSKQLNVVPRGLDLSRIIYLSEEPFAGNVKMLQNIILQGKSNLDPAQRIRDIFSDSTGVAFANFVSLLRLPFLGFDYDPFNFGIFLDVTTGRINLTQRTDLADTYQKAKSIEGINRFSFRVLNVTSSYESNILYF